MSGPQVFAFNGDADGLCALQQLWLAERPDPGDTQLVTGLKRHVRLLEGVVSALAPPGTTLGALRGTTVTVLDVAFGENREAVERLLMAGCAVRYFDHHASGEVPALAGLEAHIDPSPRVCTSLLVDRHLGGAQRAWAVTGAFGDNLGEAAREAAEPLALPPAELERLRELGELLNYNGYGEALADLHFHPAVLFRAIEPFADPREAAGTPELERLRVGFAEDLAHAQAVPPALITPRALAVLLPHEPWARRAQGSLANRLATADPQRACAVGVALADGALRLSIRAPLARPQGADALARAFGGGGRAGAAGVNALPPGELPRFLAAFQAAFAA
jgi:hypothetical protein